MAGPLIDKLRKWLTGVFQSKADVFIFFFMLLFLALNAVKISLFNFYLTPNQGFWVFRYKLICTLLLIFITYPLLFRFRSRLVFVVFYILQTIYIIANISYYLYFHNYLHVVQAVSNFYEGFKAVQNAAAPKSPLLLTAFIDLPVFLLLVFGYQRVKGLEQKLKYLVYAVVIGSLCVSAVMEARQFSKNNSFYHIVKSMYSGESRIVERYGTLANNLVSIYLQKSSSELANSLKYGSEQASPGLGAENPDIFVVQVESLDANIVSKKYKGEYVMPWLNSLTSSSMYYPYLMSYHLGGGTSDSEFSVINSLEPLAVFPALKLPNYNSPNSFVLKLKDAGYSTAAFHGNVGKFYNRDIAFPRYGFENFYDISAMKVSGSGWGAPDGEVFDYSLDTVNGMEKPFLSYVITMSSHGPFTNVRNYYNNKVYDDIGDKVTKEYFNSMSYVDKTLGEYTAKIKAAHKNAVILIFGDHTPNVNSSYYRQASFTLDDKYFEFVPLFIVTPNNKTYKEEKYAASLLDIAPTVLNASGIMFDILSDGQDLTAPGGVPGEIPYRGGSYGREELYNRVLETANTN